VIAPAVNRTEDAFYDVPHIDGTHAVRVLDQLADWLRRAVNSSWPLRAMRLPGGFSSTAFELTTLVVN
jgi:hypothetical protein